MRDDPAFSLDVWRLPYDVTQPALSNARDSELGGLLATRGVPCQTWQPGLERELDAVDLAIFNSPYDHERPAPLVFDAVAHRVGATAYVPYGLVMGAGAENERLQYQQPVQLRADLIVARCEWERQLYRRFCPAGDHHVAVTGLPRFDELVGIDSHHVPDVWQRRIAGRTAVLWSSHFSFTSRFDARFRYSTFDRVAPHLLPFALSNDRVALIWRPHPRFAHECHAAGLLTAEEWAALCAELETEGVLVDRTVDHRTAFAASDALLTDAGSFLVEYLATSKPILYLHNPDGPGLNAEGQALCRYIQATADGRDVLDFLANFPMHTARQGRLRSEARDEHLPFLDGHAARRVVARLLDLLNSRRGLPAQPSTRDAPPHLRQLLDRLQESTRARRSSSGVLRSSNAGLQTVRRSLRRWVARNPLRFLLVDRARRWLLRRD